MKRWNLQRGEKQCESVAASFQRSHTEKNSVKGCFPCAAHRTIRLRTAKVFKLLNVCFIWAEASMYLTLSPFVLIQSFLVCEVFWYHRIYLSIHLMRGILIPIQAKGNKYIFHVYSCWWFLMNSLFPAGMSAITSPPPTSSWIYLCWTAKYFWPLQLQYSQRLLRDFCLTMLLVLP